MQFYELRKSWLGEGGRPVAQDHAQERANICLSCPLNQEKGLPEFLTALAALTVRRQIEMKNQSQLRVDGEKRLHICDGCGCVLRLKVWTPMKFITETTEQNVIDSLPDVCWQRKEIGK